MNLNDLQDKIDEELQWRKKEIERLWQSIEFFEDEDLGKTHDAITKSLILLIYSHWEGFIKRSAKIYIKYISSLNIKLDEMSENFQAIMCKKELDKLFMNSSPQRSRLKVEAVTQFMSAYSKLFDNKFFINVELDKDKTRTIIDTEDNLNADVFIKICTDLGFSIYSEYYKEVDLNLISNFSRFNQKKDFLTQVLDHTLLNSRNHIAHGNKNNDHIILNVKKLAILKKYLFLIMNRFRDDILEHSENEFFLSKNINNKQSFIVVNEKDLENNVKTILDNNGVDSVEQDPTKNIVLPLEKKDDTNLWNKGIKSVMKLFTKAKSL